MQFFRLLWWRIRYAIWHLNWRLMFRVAEWRTLHGLKVGVFGARDDQLEALVFEKIGTALGLIAAHEPRRLHRTARDIRRVWVWRDAYASACYLEAWDMCVIDLKFLTEEQTTAPKLAAVLVHEATHARLFKRGLGYNEAERRRIEDVCVAESASFARRLPDGEALSLYLVDCHPSDASQWSDETLNRRLLDARLQAVDEVSLPAWLRRLLKRILISRAA